MILKRETEYNQRESKTHKSKHTDIVMAKYVND